MFVSVMLSTQTVSFLSLKINCSFKIIFCFSFQQSTDKQNIGRLRLNESFISILA